MHRTEPGPGQESVWDYPRPPKLEETADTVEVVFAGETIAKSSCPWRMLETSHPPVYYIPREDVRMDALSPGNGASYCEWKGRAAYFDVSLHGERQTNAAWCYPAPVSAFAPIRDFIAFYPSKMAACYVNGERVRAQEGAFYGGWVTSKVVGPFKGGAGTMGW